MEKVDSWIRHSDDLWTLTGDWQNTSLRRRSCVLKTSRNTLVIHNAMELPQNHLLELNQFGRVSSLLIPNTLHDSDASWFAKEFPEAHIYAPSVSIKKLTRRCHPKKILSLENDWNHSEDGLEIPAFPVRGIRLIAESLFLHKKSKTLIFCDLAFNMKKDAFHGIEKTLMKWNRVGDGFGPSRLLTTVIIQNKKQANLFFEEISKLEFDRIIVNHGEIIESHGKKLFIQAFLSR